MGGVMTEERIDNKVKLLLIIEYIYIKMSNNTKKQHFVPQFILKNFVTENNSIWIFDKKSGKSFSSAIRDSASEKYFYQFGAKNQGIDLEEDISKLESDCAPIIQKIINEATIKNINHTEHLTICLFVAVQYLRTYRIRETLGQINEILIKELEKENINVGDIEGIHALSKNEIKESTILGMYPSSLSIAKELMEKNLALFVSSSDSEFLISDNPVTLHNHQPRPNRGNLGFKLKGIEIYFPITPIMCIVFTCPSLLDDLKNKINRARLLKHVGQLNNLDINESSNLINSYISKSPMKLKQVNVDFQNSLQVIYSSRFIYSCKDNFTMVTDMLKKSPELKSSPKLVSNLDPIKDK